MVSHQIKKFSEASREFGEYDWRKCMDRALDEVPLVDRGGRNFASTSFPSGPSGASAKGDYPDKLCSEIPFPNML